MSDRTRRRRQRQRRKSEMDDLMYYDVGFVFNELKTGGGMVRSRKRTETQEYIQYLTGLGWEPGFLQREFRELNDKLLNTWHFREFSRQYFEHLIEHLGFQSTIRESCIQIGLRPDVAAHLEYILHPLLGTSYTDIQVLYTGIYYLLGRYAPITTLNTTHCIQPQIVNKWFTHSPLPNAYSLMIYNIPQQIPNSQSLFEAALASLPHATDNSSLFFHTTSWRGALSIFKRINRQMGRPCLDFGLLPGFYMSDTSKDCIDWGTANQRVWHNEVAILVFAIPNNLPSEIKYKELKGSEWTRVTKTSRECKEHSNEIDTIYGVDLLYGNMVSNPKPVKLGREPPCTHNPPKKQLVAKTDAAETFIHTCLTGCVFFQKHIEQKQK